MGIFQNNLLAASAAAASAGGGGFYSHQIEQGYISNGDQDQLLSFNSSGSANVVDSISQWWDGATYGDLTTTQVFRDTSGWNHFLLAWDTTQSTASNRTRVYLNGTEITSFTTWNGNTVVYPTQNVEFWTFDDNLHEIGRRKVGPGNYFNGYLAEIVAIDGTQIAPTDVGEFKNGVWIPKDPSGLTFGTNGFHLKFENASDLGNDSSGNNNDFAAGGLGTDHQVTDSPTFGS
jgi:hypothetical protein